MAGKVSRDSTRIAHEIVDGADPHVNPNWICDGEWYYNDDCNGELCCPDYYDDEEDEEQKALIDSLLEGIRC